MLNENQMKFKSMRQLAEVIDAGTLKSAGLDERTIESVMHSIERVLKLDVKKTGSKLHLNIKFVEGPYANQVIKCEPNKDKVVFGSLKDITEAQVEEFELQNCQYVYLEGNRIVENHF